MSALKLRLDKEYVTFLLAFINLTEGTTVTMGKFNVIPVLVAGVFLSTPVLAELRLDPEKIEMKDVTRSEKVLVLNGSKPVLPSEITKISSGVFKFKDDVPESARDGTHFSNYSYMFEFHANDDGSIVITANENLLEVGIYDLYVETIYGTVSGTINATLSESNPSTLLQREKLPEFTYDIVLPDYSRGQQIVLNLPPDEVNTYSWYIDGELHSSGLGQTTFLAQPEPGTHEISFIARNPEGIVVSTWSDVTEVSK